MYSVGESKLFMIKKPGAQAENGGLNKRRPVSPRNPKRNIYRKAGGKL